MATITCKGENDTTLNVGIKFDVYGNLYLDTTTVDKTYFVSGPKHNLHQVCINGDNTLSVESYNYNIIGKVDDQFKDISLLQKHIVGEFEYLNEIGQGHIDEHHEYCVEEEEEEDFENGKIIDEDVVSKYGYDNYEFNFSSSKKDIEVVKIEEECIVALYDTYVYEGTDLVFSSIAKYSDSIYKITIRDNCVCLRPIGYMEKYYQICINKLGNIVCIIKD